MRIVLKKIIKNILKKLDIRISRHSKFEKSPAPQNSYEEIAKAVSEDVELLLQIGNYKSNHKTLLQNFGGSKSQIRQDLFVLSHLDFKKNGYFVDFGATNGIDMSNTYLMEKEYGWTGIVAEPATCWHEELKKNRSCKIETDCVWKETGSTIVFNEVHLAEFSTIQSYSNSDLHEQARKNGKNYDVKTISLNDLLKKHNAPRHIDYLSIDTEGSEYDILSHLDFSRHSFAVITCEHNYTPMREKIFSLLTSHGYKRVLKEISKFDDWYVKENTNQF